MTDCSQTNVFICGAARNCEQYLDDAFQSIRKIQSMFANTHIIIAYDDSNDKTLLKLTQQKQVYGDKMDILINRNPLSWIRTENIANARNSILQRMREVGGDSPFFIMMDMDNACNTEPNLDLIRRTFQTSDKWDAISFNRPNYYDIWALSIKPYIYSCWGWRNAHEVVQITRKYIIEKLCSLPSGELLECQSAFNGFGIYKSDPFLKCAYNWRIPKQYMSMHDLEENHKIVGFRPSASPLNQQTDEPDCEHRSFHMEAIANHGARIRISPECVFNADVGGHV
jgi:hypothetical protein